MNWKSTAEKPEAYKIVLLALTGENNRYTTGWYAAPVDRWIGLAMNQSPPAYELESWSVEYWCEIEPPAAKQTAPPPDAASVKARWSK